MRERRSVSDDERLNACEGRFLDRVPPSANTVRMRFGTLALWLALFFGIGCKADENQTAALEDPARVSGSLTYVQRVTLPPNAVARVTLLALSHSGAPASLINEETIADLGQLPIPFLVYYRRDTIDAHNTYALQARIVADGKTWFENREPVPVITNGVFRNVQIVLDMVAH
jgi:putative lipoprotein